MVRSEHTWVRALLKRGLVTAIMVLTLAVYGLVSSGTQSLTLKPTAAAANATAGRSVAMALSPANGSVNVATQGPNHTLYFYWEVNGTWYGPLGIGAAGSTWSAPAIVSETGANSGNFDIAVEGPNHSLQFYWDISGTWYGPYQVGGSNTTYSTPTLIQDRDNNLQMAAEGPGNSLNTFWNVNAQFYGPLGIGGYGTTFSGPSFFNSPSSNSNKSLYLWVQGPNHNALEYGRFGNTWASAQVRSNDGMVYSAISPFYTTYRGTFQGPNNTMWDADAGSDNAAHPTEIRGGGTTYSMPSVAPTTGVSSGCGQYCRDIAAEGPSNALYFYFYDTNNGGLDGPLQIGAPGSTFSAPSMLIDSNGNQDVVVQGPNHALWAYFDIAGVIHGPLQIGAAGSSYSSDS